MQTKAAVALTPLPPETSTNEELVERVLNGDTVPFEWLIRRNNPRVYRVIRALLRTESEIEDVMQAVYVSAYFKLGSFRGEASFSTWLTRIALNETLARLRHRRRHSAVSSKLLADADIVVDERGAPTPEATCSQRELAALLEAAIDDLPDLYRVVFMLREVDGMATAEAAIALDVSEDVVKTRLSRARALLRDKLDVLVGGAVSDAFGFQAPRCNRVVQATLRQLGVCLV
jgi:RNA polymerase sigma-70 factor (ECF subfamily)